jgi:glycosyltransferase involved in cell wall biosynthesis
MLATGVTTITPSLYRRALALGVPPSRLLLLPSGADVRAIQPMPKSAGRDLLGIPHDVPVVGYMGITSPERLGVVEQVFARVRQQLPQVRLLLLGPRGGAENNGASHPGWILPGMVPHTQLSPYLAAADVWLLPHGEGLPVRALWPNKLMDYLAAGRPVVAADHEDLRPLFEQHAIGLLTRPEVEDLAAEATELLSRPDQGETHGQTGRKLVEQQLDWEIITDRFEAFLAQLRP